MFQSLKTRPWPQLLLAVTPLAMTLLLCAFAPGTARAEEPTGPATEYHPEEYPPHSARLSALAAGGAVLAGSYGISLGSSYLWPGAPNSSDLRLPVIGPPMALTNAGCGSNESGCDTLVVVIRSFLTTLSGLGQVGGVFLLTEALLLPTRGEPVRAANYPLVPNTPLAGAPRLPPREPVPTAPLSPALATGPKWTPLVSESDVGLVVSGHF